MDDEAESSGVIAVLEDDARRREAMAQILAEHHGSYQAVFFDNAPDMIVWLGEHWGEVALLCLDHDLGPNHWRSGQSFDPGSGRDLVNYLLTLSPFCPVIVHSSNYLAVPGMLFALEPLGWTTDRVVPYDDLAWLERDWVPAVAGHLRS